MAVAAGKNFTLAVTDKGSIYAFGKNDVGQLGLGNDNFTDHLRPVLIGSEDTAATFDGCDVVLAAKCHICCICLCILRHNTANTDCTRR